MFHCSQSVKINAAGEILFWKFCWLLGDSEILCLLSSSHGWAVAEQHT